MYRSGAAAKAARTRAGRSAGSAVGRERIDADADDDVLAAPRGKKDVRAAAREERGGEGAEARGSKKGEGAYIAPRVRRVTFLVREALLNRRS